MSAGTTDHALTRASEPSARGCGISEFIRQLSDVLPRARAAVVTPDCTEIICCRRHAGAVPGTAESPRGRLDRLAPAMAEISWL